MSDTSNDNLRETETQMRRVLGLNHQPTPGHEPPPRTTTGVGAAHPHRRRFVRDGDVPVTVVHREHDQGAGTNKLDAAQEALHEQMAARGEFLEHADVFGNYYGTHRKFLDEAHGRGCDLLLDIDVQGASQVRKVLPREMRVSIFVLPPNRGELEKRLKRRSSAENVADQKIIQRRLQTATREIEDYREYDYILVNDKLEDSIESLKAIIMTERRKHAGGEFSDEERELKQLAEECLLANVQDRVRPILASFAQESTAARK